jgi:hypothetical protein
MVVLDLLCDRELAHDEQGELELRQEDEEAGWSPSPIDVNAERHLVVEKFYGFF